MKRILLSLFLGCLPFVIQAKVPDVKISELAPNVYLHTSYKEVKVWGLVPASGLIVVDGKDAYLIDTPWTQEGTKQLIAWLEDKGLSIKAAVVTHFHQDASGGMPYLNQLGIKTYANHQTNNLLEQLAREPAQTSIDKEVFQFAKGNIEVFYPGGGHAKDNVVVWLPKQKVMFGGCFVKSAKSRSLGNLEDAVLSQWSGSIDKVLARYREINTLVPGHGKVGNASLLEHTKQLVQAKLAANKASN